MSPLSPADRAFIERKADDLVENIQKELENLLQYHCSDHAVAAESGAGIPR